MRILDCKSPICSEIAKNAPVVLDYLCEECQEHFDGVKKCLDSADVTYTINPQIVRGLDYYTRTVFEFVSNNIGAQGTVCGGGRYDGLMEELGGQPTPSLGFGMGIERLLMVLEENNIEIPKPPVCDLYVIGLGDNAKMKAFNIVQGVRNSSLIAETDIVGRNLKKQMMYANKINAKFTMVIGDSELENNKAKLRNMATKEEKEISLDENFFTEFFSAYTENENQSLFNIINEM